MSAADIEDSGPALVQRVAALEAAMDRLEALERRMVTLEAAALKRGDLAVNDVRAGLGLPEIPVAGSRDEATDLRELRDLQLACGVVTEEEHALLAERDACQGREA